MTNEKKQSPVGGAPATANGELNPEPPKIIANLMWLRIHARKHWGIVVLALLVLVGGWLLSSPQSLVSLQNFTETLVNWRIQNTVKELRKDYRVTRESLSRGAGNFAEVDKAISDILTLDPRNGHGLYYAGEVKRIKNKSLFTAKSCLIAERLAARPESLDPYENDFHRYLDTEKALPDNLRTSDYSAEKCYESPTGFCPQRTAWVHHLLANDLYEQAKLMANTNAKVETLRRTIEHAQTAADMYKDENEHPGFQQCIASTVLVGEAKEAIKEATANLKR